MKYGLIIIVLAWVIAADAAPPIVVQSSIDSVCVKLTDSSACESGDSLSYVITHWPDGEQFASGSAAIKLDASGLPSFTIGNLKPKLWSPQDPQLYMISVSDSQGRELVKTRFGFRTFEIRDRKFHLNGRPILLRGIPINPPGRDLDPALDRDPAFIHGYLKLVKSAGVNMIRTESQEWLDACDKLGIMVFTGRYGPAPGGKGPIAPPFEQARPFYRDMVLDLCSHPSVTIYVLTNEVDYKSKDSTYPALLTKIRDDIRSLDPTRPVIGNAGFGHGKPGEIYDIHRYAGWYHGSFVDWYADLAGFLADAAKAGQPLTLTECVGAYTSDAGVFETMSKQLCTMMQWVGAAEDTRAASQQYQAELVRQVVEIARRSRTAKTGVTGIMPFTYFLGWAHAGKAEDIIIKPAFETLKVVYQPILISPECWRRNLYAGEDLTLRLCVINDDDLGKDLAQSQAIVEVTAADGGIAASGKVDLPAVPYYSNAWKSLSIPIPAGLARGYYDVKCGLISNGVEVSHNSFSITIAPREWVKCPADDVTLFDPSGKTADALNLLGVGFRQTANLKQLPASGILVLGEGALGGDIRPDKAGVEAFVRKGGRILCLRQDRETWNGDWLPAAFNIQQRRPYRPFTYIQPMGRNKAIFRELTDRDLRFWNELDLTPTGNPDVYPVLTPLRPNAAADLKSARVWAACGQLLSGAAILEVYHGKGSIILSQFRTVERVGTDPIAAKLLANLISYTASGASPGMLDLTKPIRWDTEAFRAGAFQSLKQGFLPHSKTYKHEGGSKGLLGEDHRIDGSTLVGDYGFTSNGWLRPVPDPAAEGWGIFYGTLNRPVTRFAVTLRNLGNTPARIALRLDGRPIGSVVSMPAGEERTVEWACARDPGPVEVELRGDQRLLITETRFR